MKQRLIIFLQIILVLVSTFSFLAPAPKINALTSQDTTNANDYCRKVEGYNTQKDPGNINTTNCVEGYTEERTLSEQNESTSSSAETLYCTTGGRQESPCSTGWNAAATNTKPGSPGSTEQGNAQVLCNQYSGSKLNFCQQAFTNQCKSYAALNVNGTIDPVAQACFDGAWDKTNGESNSCNSESSTSEKASCDDGYANTSYTAPAASTVSGASTPTCENDGDNAFQLAWIFCPVIIGLAGAVDGIYSSVIQPLLYTQPVDISNSSPDPTNTYKIWANFRVYGDIFLILVLLVIVFGEAIGGGLIDAYTAKKVLPRLLIAAVLINLSIYIVAFAVDITNILGNGIQALIEQPFKSGINNGFSIQIKGVSGDLGVLAIVTGLFAVKAFAAPLAEFLLLFFLIPAFLTMVAIMVTVLLRKGLILFLIFISPVAFVLYCLPNTEKYFRQWWDLLLRTLMIYPIIAVLFAMGNVLSVTINDTTSGITASISSLLALIALFVPLFMIPFAFRISGGLLGRFHEFATTSRKQAHEAIKGQANDPSSWRNQVRGKMRMRRVEKGVTGQALATNFLPPTNPFRSSGRQQWSENREARREADRQRAGQQYTEADAIFQANKGNDQYLVALANPELAAKRAASASPGEKGAWNSAIAAARITHKSPATRLQAANSLAATGFQFATGQQGYNELAETIADITGAELVRNDEGNVIRAKGSNAGTYAQAMNYAQFAGRNGGRFDIGGINNGTGYDFKSGVSKSSGWTASSAKPATWVAGAESYLGSELQGDDHGKTKELPDLTADIEQNLRSGKISPDDVVEWHDTLLDGSNSPTGANKKEIRKQIMAIEQATRNIAGSGVRTTYPNTQGLDPVARLNEGIINNQNRRRAVDERAIRSDQENH